MEKIEDKDIELHIDRETLLQEYIPRKDYEQRLKADMIAMLTDLQLEIEKVFDNRPLPCSHYQRTLFYGEVDDLILDKIDLLKGENEVEQMVKTNKFNELFCKPEMYTKDEVLEILKEIDSDISNFCRWQNDEGIYVDEVSLHLIIERRIKGMRGEE